MARKRNGRANAGNLKFFVNPEENLDLIWGKVLEDESTLQLTEVHLPCKQKTTD